MRVTGQRVGTAADDPDWAGQTRQVLTRELLVRASRARPDERRALQFRALHLNLPLVGEVADGLGLTERQRRRVEQRALGGLLEAVRRFDPYGDQAFAEFAAPLIARRMTPGQTRLIGARLLSPRRGTAAPR